MLQFVNELKGTSSAISNFIPYATEKITYTNGKDENTFYLVNCQLLDNTYKKLPPQKVDEASFLRMDFVSKWNKDAIINYPQPQNANKLKFAMQLVNKLIMQEKIIFAHTGLREINGEWCYLYHNGIIGNAQNVDVDLSNNDEAIGLQRYSFTNKKFNVTESIKLSYSLLDLAEHSVTVPLIAISFLAPIYSILRELKIYADFVLYLQGKTGVRKSSLTAIFLSLFGKFDRDSFPSTFRDTLNVIEQKAFILKDTLNVVDDFKPEQNLKAELAILEGILAMYGDRVGRGRMNKDGQTRKSAYTARGLCIVTGETVPNIPQSRLARCIIANVKQDSVNLEKLSYMQNNAEQLSFAMKEFISFMLFKPNIEPIKLKITSKYNELRQLSSKYELHGRTKEIGDVLKLGFYIFTLFLSSYGIIDEITQKKLEADAKITIDELLIRQSIEVEESTPINMFFDALGQLLSTKKIIVKDINDKSSVNIYENNEFVGFVDTDKNIYYLIPDILFNKINSFYMQGDTKFPINAKTLWRYLHEAGYLEMYQPGNGKARYKWSKSFNGQPFRVIKIRIPETGDDVNDILSNYAPPRDIIPRGIIKDNFVF